MMNYKELITFSIIPWINVLMLYVLNFFKIEYTLIGVYHELTMLPSLLLGCIFPLPVSYTHLTLPTTPYV